MSASDPAPELARTDRETIETLCLVWLVSAKTKAGHPEAKTAEEIAAKLGMDLLLTPAVAQAYEPLVARGLVVRGAAVCARDATLSASAEGERWLNAELARFGVLGG